jgi:hypothetical protein
MWEAVWETLVLCLLGGKVDEAGIVNGGCVVDKVRDQWWAPNGVQFVGLTP